MNAPKFTSSTILIDTPSRVDYLFFFLSLLIFTALSHVTTYLLLFLFFPKSAAAGASVGFFEETLNRAHVRKHWALWPKYLRALGFATACAFGMTLWIWRLNPLEKWSKEGDPVPTPGVQAINAVGWGGASCAFVALVVLKVS